MTDHRGGLKDRLAAAAPDGLPLLARLGFLMALGPFFWQSAITKIDGVGLSAGAYAQILPRLAERVGYDPQAMPLWAHGVVAAGTLAEFVLPALIALGLATRLAALGMTVFIVVMTLTDIFGHGAAVWATVQPRLLWFVSLAVLFALGGGRWSADGIWPQHRSVI